MELITVKGLSVAYGGNLALHDIDLVVRQGDYLCIVGENGSGKSTLMKALFGLVKINEGEVRFHIPKEQVSYLPQINLAQRDFPATVREVVLCGTQKKGKSFSFYSKEDRRQAENAMERLEITSIAGKRIGDLSGGQQQRALLARALCREPKLLILDEPCAGLDAVITEEFYTLLAQLRKKQGVSIVMASHDMEQVERYASRVVQVNHTVEYDGTAGGWISRKKENRGL